MASRTLELHSASAIGAQLDRTVVRLREAVRSVDLLQRRRGFRALPSALPLSLAAILLGVATSPLLGADGFGDRATGGTGGVSVTVSTPGDLAAYASSPLPYVITVSGSITASANVQVASNKTIQGADSNATLSGDLLIGAGTRNVIVRSLNLTNPAGVGEGDGITIINGARNIFVTHCTFTDCADGELDVTNQSDSVTISWCRFRYVNQSTHRNVNLIGSSDATTADLGYLHVTIHHCWFDQMCTERMPSVRFGRVHVYNNYYSASSNNYCVRTRLFAECLVENCYFDGIQNPWELLTTSGSTGKLRATNNSVPFLDTSQGVTWVSGWYPGQSLISGTDSVFSPPYLYLLTPTQEVKDTVIAHAGNRGQEGPDAVAPREPVVSEFTLSPNYPNPFNATTNISFTLPSAAFVSLRIVDMLGKEVARIVMERLEAGTYHRRWSAEGASSGIYFCRLEAGSGHATSRLVVLK